MRLFLIAGVVAVAGTHALAAAPEPEEHVVEMVLADGAYRFVPEVVEARPGDRVVFVNVSGGPHNVAFDPERVSDSDRAAVSAMLPDRIAELAGPLLTEPGARYTVTVARLAPGRYGFLCLPHVAMDMRGTLVVVGGS